VLQQVEMRAGILIIGRLPRPTSSQEAGNRKTLGIIANSEARSRPAGKSTDKIDVCHVTSLFIILQWQTYKTTVIQAVWQMQVARLAVYYR